MPLMRAPRPLRLTAVLLALLFPALLAACGKDAGSQPPGNMPPPEVVVKTVTSADLPLAPEFMGQVAGSREVEVRARVSGILLRRDYQEGGRVKQDDLLFEIDPEPYKAALGQAEGALDQARARLVNGKRNLERMNKLIATGVISQKDNDDARTEYDAASAAVRAAEAKVREARINLGYTGVTAPISGVTSKETRSEGSLVGTAVAESLLTTINRIDPVYVSFSIPGPEAQRYRKSVAEGRMAYTSGDTFGVRLLLPDGSVYRQEGRINFMDTQVDPSTGVVKARAEFPNPDGVLLPGQFTRVRLTGAVLRQSMTIPQGSVLRTQQGAMVWVVDDKDVVSPRPVTLGDTLGNDYLVEGGLKPGERVIVEGIIKVRPGAPVNPHEAGSQAASAQGPGQNAGRDPAQTGGQAPGSKADGQAKEAAKASGDGPGGAAANGSPKQDKAPVSKTGQAG